MSATDNRKKAYIRDYLSDSGIKANSKGYKALYYAILEAVEHPGYSCSELFEKAAEKLSAENKKTIEAIGVSGQQHGFVPLDKDGKALYNIKLWCDTATTEQCAYIT